MVMLLVHGLEVGKLPALLALPWEPGGAFAAARDLAENCGPCWALLAGLAAAHHSTYSEEHVVDDKRM